MAPIVRSFCAGIPGMSLVDGLLFKPIIDNFVCKTNKYDRS